jgi:peptidoglycan/LPS O-acetylase OafA/YrhL
MSDRNNFDFLRFALAALVIFSHSFALLSGTDATEPLHRLTRGQMCSGELAVDGFFILSGFLVTHSWLRNPSLGSFFAKRVRRIYPGFAVVMILTAVLLVPVALEAPLGTGFSGALRRAAIGLSTLRAYDPPGVFPNNACHAINGSLWSIPFEAWCYVGVAALGLLGACRRRGTVLALLLGSIVVSLVFVVWDLRLGGKFLGVILGAPRLWSRLLPYFLSGMVFYLHRDRIRYTARGAFLAVLALVAATFIPRGWCAAGPLAGAYLLFWIGFHPSLRFHGWAKHGDFSYGMYLYAFPVQQMLIQKLHLGHPLLLLALSLPASVAMGALSWHAVEKWFLARRPKPAPPLPRLDLSASSAS